MANKVRAGVKVKDNNIELAIKRFNSVVYHAGILQQYMDNMYYTKPSEERAQRKKEKKFKSYLNNKLNP